VTGKNLRSDITSINLSGLVTDICNIFQENCSGELSLALKVIRNSIVQKRTPTSYWHSIVTLALSYTVFWIW